MKLLQTGLTVQVSLRDLGGSRAKLGVSINMSSVTGYSGSVPIISKDSFSVLSSVLSGGTFLLGSVDRTERADRVSGIFDSVYGSDNDSRLIQIWCRAYRIAGPVLQAENNGVPNGHTVFSGGENLSAAAGDPD